MDLRRLLLVTTVTTAMTALVGVLTATAGAGLTCGAQWPLCDGAVFGLFPANFMSFIEWFHRLVAMTTGFLIVGSTIGTWRGTSPKRVQYATLGALLLTPLQIVFGAFTVTTYSILVLTLHFGFASSILGLLVAATVWAYMDVAPVTTSKIQRAATIALVAFPLLIVLTPRLFFTFDEVVQFVYYGLGFGTFSMLVVVALWSREVGLVKPFSASGTAAVLVIVQFVIARQSFGDAGQLLIIGISVAGFAMTAFSVWRVRAFESPSHATQLADD